MSFKNLCFVVGIFLLLVTSTKAAVNTPEKLTRRCKDNERRALLDFKAGLDDYFGTLSSWGNNSNNEEECCNWRGIRCSNRTGHVTLLNLPGNDNLWLRGKISPSLSELKHLKYLNLGHNGFSGEIPPQLGNLTNLRVLDLEYNGGNGELTVQNLEWISHLHLLTHLDLSLVDLSNCNGWLNQIFKLSSLTHLHLQYCSLPDQFGPLINTSFSPFNSLVVADLSGNNFISPKSYNWIFNFTTTLVSLHLSFNPFKSEIPEDFGRIISLESLSLSGCEIEGTLPDSFRNLSRLATLDISANNLNGSLSEFLHPLATKEKNSLQVLMLQENQLDGSLPDYFTTFPSLREMVISENNLNGSFPDNFWQLSSSLVHLDLSNNQLTGPLPNLTLFSSLETMSLYNNKLEGMVPEAYLSNLSKLTILDLNSNSLSFNLSFDWFPPFKLDKILLGNCTLGPHFPNWIKSQHTFSSLDISSARISDTIPLWFWDLSPGLEYLNMSNNRIKGMLPNISQIFPDMEWLHLSYNLLQGPVPPLPLTTFILNLAHNMFTGSLSLICPSLATLSYLDLSDNKLSGELPADCLMNNQLSLLNLANNDFYGNIPTSIGTLDQLQSLLLRNNRFTGQIPLSLMNNTELWLLDLSENKLNGEVPTWMGTHLTSLIVLSLRKNGFSGSIPPQICHMRNAHVLDLSQNKLTGSIPHCINNLTSLIEVDDSYVFEKLTEEYGDRENLYPNALVQWKRVASEYKTSLEYLKLIDLSGNRLVGEIPEEFSSLKDLRSLNLSSNRLTGNLFPKIGQMENLESLDLSRNQLSGEIPSGLASLTFLSVLDLSNNNLTGKIPSSTQLQSFDASTYAGNEHLWGPPLSNKSGGVISPPTGHDDKGENDEVDDAKIPEYWLCGSVVLGFGTGFWGFIGPLTLRRRWRHSYYKFLGDTADWICITTMLLMTRLRRKFYA